MVDSRPAVGLGSGSRPDWNMAISRGNPGKMSRQEKVSLLSPGSGEGRRGGLYILHGRIVSSVLHASGESDVRFCSRHSLYF